MSDNISAEEASSKLEAYLCRTVKLGVQAAAQLGGVQGVDLVEDFALWMGSQVEFFSFDINEWNILETTFCCCTSLALVYMSSPRCRAAMRRWRQRCMS